MKHLFIVITCLFLLQCTMEPSELIKPNLITAPLSFNDITLNILPDSLIADGNSFAEVFVKIDPKFLKYYKEVLFEISPYGKFNNSSALINVPLDLSGEGRAFISSSASGKSFVKASFGSINKVGFIEFFKQELDTLKISVTQNNILANNYSNAEITAITIDRPHANNQIVFVADKGTFTNNSNTYIVQASLNDTTKAYLKHNKAEPVRVSATIYNSYSKEVYATFLPAFPEAILISPSVHKLQPQLSSSANIVAKLIRNEGVVSENQSIIFYDSTSIGNSVGIFLNITKSNSNGEAMAEYWLQDTSFHGLVYIIGSFENGSNSILGMNRILIE